MKNTIYVKGISIIILSLIVVVCVSHQGIEFIVAYVAAKNRGQTSMDLTFSPQQQYFDLQNFYSNDDHFVVYCRSTRDQQNLIRKIFLQHEIPEYLISISFVKTRFQNKPGLKNSGIWYFSPFTAQMYDLQVGPLIDERMDIQKSTVAAALYLKDVYELLGDWNLAIIAYEVGEGSVLQAIKNLDTRDPQKLEAHFKTDILQKVLGAQLFLASKPCP